jgi:hypothetical protein
MMGELALSMAMAAEPSRALAAGMLPTDLTFCGRMVGPMRMRPQVHGKGTVYITQLKGKRGRIGYVNTYDSAKVPAEHLADYKDPCQKNAERIRCIMRGPGKLTVQAGGASSDWPIHEGEEALIVYDGDRLACQDFRSE